MRLRNRLRTWIRRPLDRRRRVVLGVAIVGATLLAGVPFLLGGSDDEVATTATTKATIELRSGPTATTATTATTTTAPVAPTTDPTRSPSTSAPTIAVPPAPPPAPAPPPTVVERQAGPTAFAGLGAWLDVWDWSPTYTGGAAVADVGSIDRMGALGVRTVYIQTARHDRPEDVLDAGLLVELIERAHSHGMHVVGWYLPTFVDPDADLRRLLAAAQLPFDGLGVDVESRILADHGLRSQRLVDLSAQLNHAVPHLPLAAITLPPVVTEIINPAYWPGHPWAGMAPYYDVWMPMAYWGNRTAESGWRDGYRYTAENIDLIRELTRQPRAIVHPIGGVASDVTHGEVVAMVAAARDRGAIGGSVYDYLTTGDDLWPALQGFTGF